jgi:hypothetical protein
LCDKHIQAAHGHAGLRTRAPIEVCAGADFLVPKGQGPTGPQALAEVCLGDVGGPGR